MGRLGARGRRELSRISRQYWNSPAGIERRKRMSGARGDLWIKAAKLKVDEFLLVRTGSYSVSYTNGLCCRLNRRLAPKRFKGEQHSSGRLIIRVF